MKLNHIINSQQFTLPLIRELFERVHEMEKIVKRGGTRDYDRKIMSSLFFDSSSLTRFSFEAAMSRLGGKVLTMENAPLTSMMIHDKILIPTYKLKLS